MAENAMAVFRLEGAAKMFQLLLALYMLKGAATYRALSALLMHSNLLSTRIIVKKAEAAGMLKRVDSGKRGKAGYNNLTLIKITALGKDEVEKRIVRAKQFQLSELSNG